MCLNKKIVLFTKNNQEKGLAISIYYSTSYFWNEACWNLEIKCCGKNFDYFSDNVGFLKWSPAQTAF